MSSNKQAPPSRRDRVISVVAVALSLCFLGLGFASYAHYALSPFFIVLSTVGSLFLGFLQVFPTFTLDIPGLHFRSLAKWLVISVCVLSLLLNVFLLGSLFFKERAATVPQVNGSGHHPNVATPTHAVIYVTPSVIVPTATLPACNVTNSGSTGKGNIVVACQNGKGDTINVKQGS